MPVQIKFMTKTAKYTWIDNKRNQDILYEIKTESSLMKIMYHDDEK